MKAYINMDRVEVVSELLSKLGPWSLMELEEKLDPQFSALRNLSLRVGKGWASVYALLVSLVSYRLAMRGEEWWDCMSRMITSRRSGKPPSSLEEVVEDVLWFLDNCKGSLIARDAKKKRVQLAYRSLKRILEDLASNPDSFYSNAGVIVGSIARALNVENWRKTVVFTAKMIYYAIREPGERRLVNLDIPIPVDTRVACASYASAVVEAPDYKWILRNPRLAQEAWSIISKNTGIPLLNLDTLLWLTGWAPRDLGLDEARREVERVLSRVVNQGIARDIALNLYIRRC